VRPGTLRPVFVLFVSIGFGSCGSDRALGPDHAQNAGQAVTPTLEAPADPVAVATTSSEIVLTWSDVSGERGFEIHRSTTGAIGYWVIASLPPNATSWRGALAPGYTSAVIAIKDGGPYY